MHKINTIFNKEVINQSNGEKIATVQDIVLDHDVRHVLALLIRGSGLLASSQVIRWNAVVSIGDVVVVRADTPFQSLKEDAEINELVKQANRITGTSVISDKGEQLGSVSDIFIDDQGNVTGYEINQGLLHSAKYLSVQNVQAPGKDAIIATTADLPRVKDVSSISSAPATTITPEPANSAPPVAPSAPVSPTNPGAPVAEGQVPFDERL